MSHYRHLLRLLYLMKPENLVQQKYIYVPLASHEKFQNTSPQCVVQSCSSAFALRHLLACLSLSLLEKPPIFNRE